MDTLNRRGFLGTAAAAGLAFTGPGREAPRSASRGLPGKTRFAVNVECWWRKLPFLDRVRAAAAAGFPAIEFWPYEGKPLPELRRLTDELGLTTAQFTAWGFSPGMNDPKHHDLLEKRILEACKVAQQLNCPMMTVVGGNDIPGVSQSEMHDHIIAGLKRVAPIAEDHNVMLILEPMNVRHDHKGHCLYGSAPAIRICQAVGSTHVKINWDLYHMQITEGDLCRHLKEGVESGQVGYLQLADNPGRREPGTGEIHYNRVLKEAWDLGYRGFVGLECFPEDSDAAVERVRAADVW